MWREPGGAEASRELGARMSDKSGRHHATSAPRWVAKAIRTFRANRLGHLGGCPAGAAFRWAAASSVSICARAKASASMRARAFPAVGGHLSSDAIELVVHLAPLARRHKRQVSPQLRGAVGHFGPSSALMTLVLAVCDAGGSVGSGTAPMSRTRLGLGAASFWATLVHHVARARASRRQCGGTGRGHHKCHGSTNVTELHRFWPSVCVYI